MIRVFIIIFAASLVIYTDSSVCKMTSFKKIHPPRNDFKNISLNGKTDDGSINAKSCGPSGTPPIRFSSIPNVISNQTRSIELDLTASLLSDFSSGIAEIRINFTAPGSSPPDSFIALAPLDCSSFSDDIPCPFPLKEKDWISVSFMCKPKTVLKIGEYKAKGSIRNSSMVLTLCIEGSVYIYE